MAGRGRYALLALWVLTHRGLVSLGLAVLSGLALTAASGLEVDADTVHLLPRDLPTARALADLEARTGGVYPYIIAVTGPADARSAYVSRLAARLSADPSVGPVFYEIPPALLGRLGSLRFRTDELEEIRHRLTVAVGLGPSLANPLLSARILELPPGSGVAPTLPYLENGTESRLVMLPRGSAHDLAFSQSLVETVAAAIAASQPREASVTIDWVGGAYLYNVEDYRSILHDITRVTAASFFLVLLLMWLRWRQAGALVTLLGPLLLANLWTLGVAAVSFGSLNTFTSFASAVLLGVGIEVGIHLQSRVQEELAIHSDLEAAIVRAWENVGPACTAATLTSAAGFAALAIGEFGGFFQLGWILSIGMVVALGAYLLGMPLLLVRFPPRPALAASPRSIRGARWSGRRLVVVSAIVLVVIGGAGWTARALEIEYDISALRRDGRAFDEMSAAEQSAVQMSYSPVVVWYDDFSAMVEAQESIEADLRAGRLSGVRGVLSLASFAPGDEPRRLALLRELAAAGRNPASIYLPSALREALDTLGGSDLSSPSVDLLPAALEQVLVPPSGGWNLLLFPEGNLFDLRESRRLLDTVGQRFGLDRAAGEFLALASLMELLERDVPRIAGLALVLVALTALLDLRSLRLTAFALAVLGAGSAVWLGLLALFGVRLTLLNCVGVPIVFGIGIDVVIHMLHRARAEGPGGLRRALITTGLASVMGTATTSVAFGALGLASTAGIRGFGHLVVTGEVVMTVAGLTLVPLGFALVWSRQGRS